MSEAAATLEETQTPAVEPVAPEVPEPEAEAPTEAVVEEAQSAEVEPEQTPEQKAEAEAEKHKRAGGWKRKLERQERELQMLRDELARRTQPAAPEPEKTSEQKAAEYIDSLVRQRLDAERAQEKAARAQAEFQRRTLEVKQLHPDFDEVVMSADVPVSAVVSEALLTSEHGPAIMYRLASDPDELARISALPPLDAVRAIGRLEAQASSTAAPKKPVNVARKPSAPAPIAPVVARGPSTVKRPEDMTYEEYSAWRDSQRNR